ncbi:disease resistance protein RPS2-like isoform X2 [Mangifera indica]|nr:disease resistance protein RPS2-like isoform X2 [Mangifera indica]XP_044480798.1 disease resistance protein RPS2-like isoform X2 [Mangifera indica]
MLNTAANALAVASKPFVQFAGTVNNLIRKQVYVKNLTKNYDRLNELYVKLCELEKDMISRPDIYEAEEDVTEETNLWLKKVEKMRVEVAALQIEYQNRPSRPRQYYDLKKLGKIIAEITEEIVYLTEVFKNISRIMIVKSTAVHTSNLTNKIIEFPSVEENVKKLQEHLRKENIKTIGVGGPRGVGKSMIMNHLQQEIEKSNLFDIVFLIKVGREGDERYIQQELLKQLKEKPEELSDEGKKNKIYEKLSNYQKYLLLLDDVFSYIDLEKVGINDEHNGKVVTASSNEQVFIGMNEVIEVNTLSDIWTVLAQHLPYSWNKDPLVNLQGLGHEKGLGHMALESVAVTSTSGSKDDTVSAISSQFEAIASTSGSKADTVSAISGHFEDQSKSMQVANISPVPEDVAMISTLGRKDELTSALPGHFEVQVVRSADKTSLTAGYQLPASSSEIVEAVVMDSTTGSKDETTSVESGHTGVQSEGLQAANAPLNINEPKVQFPPQTVTLVHEEDLYAKKSGLQKSGSYTMKSGLQKSGLYAMKSELMKSGLYAMKSGSRAIFSMKIDKIPTEDQLLQKSGLYAKKSIKTTVQKIFSHMNNARAAKVVVLGPGGVGKTTVLKALINHPNTKLMFDQIIFVTVSKYRSTAKIQNQVLRQLLLSREYSESDSQVAGRLLKVLKGKNFLLILDDLWEQIDLGAVGIPNPNSENRCRIIMAFRKLDTVHDKNEFKVVEVKPLSEKEARELFYEQSRIIRTSDIQYFAETVVKGCGGLPLLIIVSGRALAEENNVSKWRDASIKFSPSRTAQGCQTEDVIQRLKFSFDQLKEHDVKSCFLHFALFPDDQEVNIYKFIEYCIKEGLITGAQADVRKRGRDIVDVLVRASLLQVTQGGKSIKMHDLIRDLALGILSSLPKDSQFPFLSAYSRSMEHFNPGSSSPSTSLCIPEGTQFLLKAGAGLTEPPSEEEWKHAKMVFLSDNELCALPEEPNCPELLRLFLQRNGLLRVIPPSFFNYMASLEVLNLSETRIQSLPETVAKLEKLLILILRDCKCLFMLPPEVGSLTRLEVLDLRGTQIYKLPDTIGELKFLQHLEVSFYGSIDDEEYVILPHHLISCGIISKLCNLKTLSIVLYPGDARWYEDVKYIKTEVSKLKWLTSLTFHFPDTEHVQEFLRESDPWKNNLLMEFKFVIGHDVKDISSPVPYYMEFDYNQQPRRLRFVNGEKKPEEVLQILARSTAFYLDNHLNIESLSNFGVGYMNELKFCILSECPKIKTVVHVEEVEDAVFPLLETISIHRLWNLTSIWEGILPEGSFARLRILSLNGCPKLVYVFTSSTIQHLCKLEEIVIEDCRDIEQIIVEEETIHSESVALPSLKKLTLNCLPGLVNIWRGPWPLLEHISFYCCPNLKKIGIDSRFKDVIIKAEKSWWDALEWESDELRLHIENSSTIIYHDLP